MEQIIKGKYGVYKGEVINGKRHGSGVYTWNNGNRYVGQYNNDKMNGKGIYYYSNNERYEGEFIDNKYHGNGIYYYINGDRYEGEYHNDLRQGKGKIYFANGDKYEGEFNEDEINGQGIFHFSNGDRYQGEFVDGKFCGKGKLILINGNKYEGNFKDGKFSGVGIYYFKEGSRYEGNFIEGNFSGEGTLFLDNGDKYKGQFKNDEMDGEGTYFWANGDRYEGEFKKAKRTGSGVYFWSNGNRYEGEFLEGEWVGKGRLYFANGIIHNYINGEVESVVQPESQEESLKNNSNNRVVETASLEEAMERLNKLTGLIEVKEQIKRIVSSIQFEQNRQKVLGIESNQNQSYHLMFLGNPGTGKTTVARLIGDIFYHLGILEKGHLVECDRSKIVGQHIGETAILTNKAVESAMGGVLFIDEAYSLARSGKGSNDFGVEAIDTLIKSMEDYRRDFVVILAGYTNEMRELIKLNPGLNSRINISLQFNDYNDNELLEIARGIAKDSHYNINKSGERAFIELINREKVDESFANARAARNIIESAIREKAYIIGNKQVSKDELTSLGAKEFGVNIEENPENKVKLLLDELNSMVGLTEVKSMISQIISYVKFQQRKKDLGMESDEVSLHMTFLGNPGTGKTTVARIVANILKAMGILKRGHIVEVTRADLVGEYVGSTSQKTLNKIKEAYGGILFIDEAYSLYSEGNNDFGKEAIATLIKEMEDNRDKLVVIMAGYTNEMRELLNVNSGISSRIGFEIPFDDYNPKEMLKIFISLCEKNKYKLNKEAEVKIYNIFTRAYEKRDKNFGNGRLVRQYFEQVKMKQAQRIVFNNINSNDMFTILQEDID